MSQRPQYEKQDEKQEEKGHEKQEEKVHEKQGEKIDEKWRRDPLNAAAWAGILIWAGVVLLAKNMGLLAAFGDTNAWPLILTGAGLIFILEAGVRLLVPSYRRAVTGTLILGLVLLGSGASGLWKPGVAWAAVLIAIGLVMLIRGFTRNL